MNTLFLAWQDSTGRRWYTIGRLTLDNTNYEFVYTKGALEAQSEAGFQLLPSFPNLYKVYRSDELFPVFSNRLIAPSRPDYKTFIEWLSFQDLEPQPMAILARSGGKRMTDLLEVFPAAEDDGSGVYKVFFFAHGLSHAAPSSIERALQLTTGEDLLLVHDFQNPRDPKALALRTSEKYPGDMHLIGYCPRYLLPDIHKLLNTHKELPVVTVEKINKPPAPIQFRLLCRMTMKWPKDFHPFSDQSFQPLINGHHA
ncbi:MAG TPA: hypothetical protein VI306_00350 [Pyrinomonadaceae bacterium]